MPGVQSRSVQVTPNDGLFVVLSKQHCLLGDEPAEWSAVPDSDPFGALHLATTREAAFGRALLSYRPRFVDRRPLTEKIDAFLRSPAEPHEVLTPGKLGKSHFAHRVMVELRPTEHGHFLDPAPARGASPFPRHEARTANSVLRTSDRALGSRIRLPSPRGASWVYFGIWEETVARLALAVYAVAKVHAHDLDLKSAADRLGITLS